MEQVPITRQTVIPSGTRLLTPDDFATHVYPFQTLPLLKSHLHPKFAIINAGRKLATSSSAYSPQLMLDYPSLSHVLTLYLCWTRSPPPESDQDPAFHRPYDDDASDGDDEDEDDPRDDDYDDRTTRQLPCRNKKRARQVSPTTKRKRSKRTNPASGSKRNLSERAMVKHDQKFGKAEWSDRIRKWTRTSHRGIRPRVLHKQMV